ncbi:hypothetical protein CONPUDRAFT_164675 [Coniophora puteana RWD-64-598 SS2]|uniref:Uncharacterized protein n=1 Tax=Coniophora puteana (strain RWD-64-598) TaxID=741705 RepID=A0A5M3MS50_CONPW|nr:uncharacterized protein CONPUDRAFT_164675 [Coniophora puteana RWD-64-598 SS2]EIW81978.1 hypothetical protein CONPUDRAFT_164675 [Coniophora puteana RWD-64-598 SS2]
MSSTTDEIDRARAVIERSTSSSASANKGQPLDEPARHVPCATSIMNSAPSSSLSLNGQLPSVNGSSALSSPHPDHDYSSSHESALFSAHNGYTQDGFLSRAHRVLSEAHTEAAAASVLHSLEVLKQALREARQVDERLASHEEKRTAMYQLGLAPRNRLPPLEKMAGMGPELATRFPTILRQQHGDQAKRWRATADNGYTIIPEDESVIVVSKDDTGHFRLELAVIRNVLGDSDFSEHLYRWLAEVASYACSDRRDVRVRDNAVLL